MARAPRSAPGAGDDDATTGAAAGDTSGADDTDDTGAAAGDEDTGDESDDVLVTIARGPDGGYIVYAGDEPDDGDGEGTSEDDDAAAAGGGAGAAPGAGAGAGGAGAGGGQQVTSIGAALKAALDILNEDASSAGAPGSSEDQFAAGYSADQTPTPATTPRGRRGLKYPPAAAA